MSEKKASSRLQEDGSLRLPPDAIEWVGAKPGEFLFAVRDEMTLANKEVVRFIRLLPESAYDTTPPPKDDDDQDDSSFPPAV